MEPTVADENEWPNLTVSISPSIIGVGIERVCVCGGGWKLFSVVAVDGGTTEVLAPKCNF